MIPKEPSTRSDLEQIDAVTSVFSKSSVFTRPVDARRGKRRFQKDPLWRAVSKSLVFDDRKRRLLVDANSKRIRKMRLQKYPDTRGRGLSDFTKQIFSAKLAFNLIDISTLNIGWILFIPRPTKPVHFLYSPITVWLTMLHCSIFPILCTD